MLREGEYVCCPRITRPRITGPNCWDVELNKAQTLALFHCGTEHLTDPDGDFGITFWKALKVLSVPDGKTLLSLPLHFNDGKSWGLFSQSSGHDYLIVRQGLTLKTYQLP
jgi:hypothetical protein